MENKESYYMNIPATVWDTDLNAKAILCYGHITVLANKGGFCYANNKYFERVLKVSTSTVSRYLNELEELGLIKRQVIYKENSKEVFQRRIYMNIPIITGEHTHIHTRQEGVITSEQDNTTSNNTINNNTILDDDIMGKIFFKIVELYPKNRVGNRQHGLKKFKQLDINQAKLAATNLKRYLTVAGEYVKSLQNYIDQECYSEAWLKAEEETKLKKTSITNNKSKTFTTNYENF